MLHEQAERTEPRRMCERGKGEQGGVIVHASELSDGFVQVKTNRIFPMGCHSPLALRLGRVP